MDNGDDSWIEEDIKEVEATQMDRLPAEGEQVLAWWPSPLSDFPSPAHCVGGVWRRWSLIKQSWDTPGPPDLWVPIAQAKAAPQMAAALRAIAQRQACRDTTDREPCACRTCVDIHAARAALRSAGLA